MPARGATPEQVVAAYHTGHSVDDEVANVPVTFTLDWRLFHGDGSLEEGPTTWGYLLERTSAREPWRIFEQGTG